MAEILLWVVVNSNIKVLKKTAKMYGRWAHAAGITSIVLQGPGVDAKTCWSLLLFMRHKATSLHKPEPVPRAFK